MRHLTFVRSAALVAVVTLFSACGSDSTGPDFDGTFTESEAFQESEGVVQGAEQVIQSMHWGDPLVGLFSSPSFLGAVAANAPAWRHPSRIALPAAGSSMATYLSGLQTAAPGCSVSGYGSDGDPTTPFDGNENGIGDDFFVRILCTSIDSIGEGVTVAYTEGTELRLKERAGVIWGWDAALKIWSSDESSDGVDHDAQEISVEEHLGVTTDRAEYRQNGKFSQNGLDGDIPYAHASGGDITGVFTSDGDDLVFDVLFPDGGFTLAGRLWSTDLEGPNLSWHISTADTLEWSAGCADEVGQPFVDGTLLVLLNGDSEKGFSLSALPCAEEWELAIFGDEVMPTPRPLQIRGFTFPKR